MGVHRAIRSQMHRCIAMAKINKMNHGGTAKSFLQGPRESCQWEQAHPLPCSRLSELYRSPSRKPCSLRPPGHLRCASSAPPRAPVGMAQVLAYLRLGEKRRLDTDEIATRVSLDRINSQSEPRFI